jgi:hypothetical protein
MLWKLLRFLFWRPRYVYSVVVGKSHASADEAAKSAELQVQNSGGEAVGIAASAMCCAKGEQGAGTAEWDVYVLIRK